MPHLVLALTMAAAVLIGCTSDQALTPSVRSEIGEAAEPTQARGRLDRLPVAPGALLLEVVHDSRKPSPPGWAPIHPATAEYLPGYPELGTKAGVRGPLSPNGRWILSSSGGNSPASPIVTLSILDLETFAARNSTEIHAPQGIRVLGWTPDSSTVFVSQSHCPTVMVEGRCAVAWVHELWVIGVESGGSHLLLEPDFRVGAAWVAPDGERVYVLGYRMDSCCGIDTAGAAFLAAIDAASGSVLAIAELPEVTFGERAEQRANGDDFTVELVPGLTVSPDGSNLYVVHADEDRVTVVDLERMQAAPSIALGRAASPLARLGSWLAGLFVEHAEAKGGLLRVKRAELSADGRWLYIGGAEDSACPDSEAVCERRPLPLQIVEVSSMRIVREIPFVSSFRISPDGRWLVGVGSGFRESDGRIAAVGYGVKVVDLASHEVVAHLRPGVDFRQAPVISPDSRYAYLVSDGPNARPGLVCHEDCTRLEVVDLLRGEVIAERLFRGHVGLLSFVPAR